MLDTLRQPKWLAAAMVVVLLAATFVALGIWQLDRLAQRRAVNAAGMSRLQAPATDLAEALAETGADPGASEYRRVRFTGVFDPDEEVLIRSQVELGTAGFHVITPLVRGEGPAVLVNRGWVPLEMDEPPVPARPPRGETTVEGWLHLTQTRPPLGPEEPSGEQKILSRVDIDRIGTQVPYSLYPVYVVATGERGDRLPLPLQPPDFTDEGPHLAYAIQWFGFAVIAVVGFYALMRRRGTQSR